MEATSKLIHVASTKLLLELSEDSAVDLVGNGKKTKASEYKYTSSKVFRGALLYETQCQLS